MEPQFLIICTELGIIAISGILIIVLLSKLFTLLERNLTPELYKLLRDAISNKTNQNNSRISTPVQRTTPVQASPVQPSPVQYPQKQFVQEAPAENIQEQQIKAEIPREIGIVFCRNCGQSFLSNEKACPHCKTVR